MPVWGRRGSYVAVTWTVVALALIGSLAALVRRSIPPSEPNSLSSDHSVFLQRASHQPVNWRLMEDDPFAEARRLDLPVMVFAGSAVSQGARSFDDAIFSQPEVAARLNRDFVSVRLDLVTRPEWRSAFLSVLRNQVGADPGFVLWFFSPEGRLLTWVGRRSWSDKVDYNDLLGTLGEVLKQWRSLSPQVSTRAEREQREEVDVLRHGHTLSLPDFSRVPVGLTRQGTFVEWQPGAYRALLSSGSVDTFNSLLSSALFSPRFDLVDGGFFRLASGQDMRLVEFDKSAAVNAQMLAVVARALLANGDPVYKYAYERAVQCIKSSFVSGDDWSSYIESNVTDDERSPRHSFGIATLRTEFSSKARGFADQLGLDPRSNPLMVPTLSRSALTENRAGLDEFVKEAQTVGDPSVDVGSKDSVLDSVGIVVARTIEAARLMDDSETLSAALSWSKRLSQFRAGIDDVVHSSRGRGRRRKWLGDYTSYADAMMQTYMATGNAASLRDGEQVLRRALVLFARGDKGDFVATSGSDGPSDFHVEMPSVVDDGAPPALPALMQQCYRYGCVLGDAGLRSIAFDIAERFASVANQEPGSFYSYFGAASEVLNTGCHVYGTGTPLADIARFARNSPRFFCVRAAEGNKEVPEHGLRAYMREGAVPVK
ncbi:MAG TPA: DUF255 domain-containing protein [Fimbriimonadaceae bacterium]|nr:DUF255 domain-containing protein [Fimbriimonadaceae bacterium]